MHFDLPGIKGHTTFQWIQDPALITKAYDQLTKMGALDAIVPNFTTVSRMAKRAFNGM